jgi:integrase
MALLILLRRMERRATTAHGFRSSVRSWCGESTGYAREVVEAALAHTLKDKAEAAYAAPVRKASRRSGRAG